MTDEQSPDGTVVQVEDDNPESLAGEETEYDPDDDPGDDETAE